MRGKRAFLFPGQGAFYSGALQDARRVYPCVESVFKTIDEVSNRRLGKSVSDLVWRSGKKSFDEYLASLPDVLQLAIYAVSVATHDVLRVEGVEPDVLVGHSFGEIAALVCAGRYTVSQGAEIVCDRVEALAQRADRDGFMVAMQVKAEQVESALAMLAEPRAVAAVLNHDRQTVVSGPTPAMTKLLELCRAMKWSAVRINSPYAFHSPLMAGARLEFSDRLKQYPTQSANRPVYSPIFSRYYGDADDPAIFLAEHLVMPVRFRNAVIELEAKGFDTFVECGALDALGKITKQVLGAEKSRIFPTLGNGSDEIEQLRLVIQSIQEEGPPAMSSNTNAITASQLDEFWEKHSGKILSYMKSELQTFVGAKAAASGSATTPTTATTATAPTAAPTSSPARAGTVPRKQLFSEVVKMYAEAMEYPSEVFTESVELEAELGIDSVRQTELMARLSEHYQLPARPADFRMSDYRTMGQIVDFIHGNQVGAVALAA